MAQKMGERKVENWEEIAELRGSCRGDEVVELSERWWRGLVDGADGRTAGYKVDWKRE